VADKVPSPPMADSSHSHAQSRGAEPNARARRLVVVLSAVGFLCGIVALIAEGGNRTGFGAAALVLLITASYCVFAPWFESPADDICDMDEPPPAVPLPQSPVTQIYDPPPDNSLERTREK